MNISELQITKFRHLNDIKIKLGDRLTAIAGQNGTGKSTVLGLLGHVYKKNQKQEHLMGNFLKLNIPKFSNSHFQISTNQKSIYMKSVLQMVFQHKSLHMPERKKTKKKL